MKLLKIMLATVIAFGVVLSHPVMAVPEPTQETGISAETCTTAGRYIADVLRMIQEGRTNIEIMSWLDSVTPDAKEKPQAYLGVVMVKLNVVSARVALTKAYKPSVIRQKQISDCMTKDGTQLMVYGKTQ
jgi:hypothetical protein